MLFVKSKIQFFLLTVILCLSVCSRGYAQFNPIAAGTMRGTNTSLIDTTSTSTDTTYRSNFTIKKFFNSLSHKDTMTLSNVFFGSMVVPGAGQIYNRDYWKVPVVYSLLGGSITGAVISNQKWKKDRNSSARNARDMFIWGAVATYWGQLMDGTARYKSYEPHLPARATIYSALIPGLGQAYNGDYWHIPIYYGGFMLSGYCWAFNQKQYKRYRNMLKEVAEGTYTGTYSQSDLIWYRDSYRRNRDYSIVATILIYVLNVIDANVFAHFANFDISDDITFNVQPTIIEPTIPSGGYYVQSPNSERKFGFQMNITF